MDSSTCGLVLVACGVFDTLPSHFFGPLWSRLTESKYSANKEREKGYLNLKIGINKKDENKKKIIHVALGISSRKSSSSSSLGTMFQDDSRTVEVAGGKNDV
jgi:hypothetical protein